MHAICKDLSKFIARNKTRRFGGNCTSPSCPPAARCRLGGKSCDRPAVARQRRDWSPDGIKKTRDRFRSRVGLPAVQIKTLIPNS